MESQVSELKEYCGTKRWLITEIYHDAGWSRSVIGRPALDRLRDDGRSGTFDAVLVNDVDHLARDVVHLGIIKRDLERANIQVIFRKLPIEPSPTSHLLVNVLGSFAECERELICDRTRRGRRYKVEYRNQSLGCNTAYGYRYTRIDRLHGRPGCLEIDPEEAEVE